MDWKVLVITIIFSLYACSLIESVMLQIESTNGCYDMNTTMKITKTNNIKL